MKNTKKAELILAGFDLSGEGWNSEYPFGRYPDTLPFFDKSGFSDDDYTLAMAINEIIKREKA